MKKLFIVSGEHSGDTHGAGLMAALLAAGKERGDDKNGAIEISGLGGPLMAELSSGIEDWLADAAVLGLWEVLQKYAYFRGKMEETVQRISQIKPDGVVLVDYPGFNLRLTQRLRKEGYQGKLIYYISPQVWAWKKGRIPRMAKWLDLMICIFPFEKQLYETSGLKTVFAGHPLVDQLHSERAEISRDENLLALLPGSREREIESLFPAMVEAARVLTEQDPSVRFASAAPSEKLQQRMREIAADTGLTNLEVGLGNAHELMQRASAGVVTSGTATLESAVFALPYCLVYRVAWPTYLAAKLLMDIQYLGIVNILAGKEVVKELLQKDACAESIVVELGAMLNDVQKREALQSSLAEVVAGLGGRGAYRQAAQAVEGELGLR
ncbi:MAG: lipid-A-disaccharide synthase [Verrucomicrobiales bacterium]|nr:lipid-A-disaccharide synthase [Verrucomicrobiales bacterium]